MHRSLELFRDEAQQSGCICDAAMSMGSDAAANAWRIRGGISASLSRHGAFELHFMAFVSPKAVTGSHMICAPAGALLAQSYVLAVHVEF